MEKEYYDAQVKYINEIRSIRHDIEAHMIVLQHYLDSENYEKAKAYLGDMRRHQDMPKLVIKDTGNDLVNAILSDTLSRSTKRINFEMEGILSENVCISEYDICTLFSNLFSNAREACEKLMFTNPEIQMEVKEGNQECFISIQNPIEWKIEMEGSRFVSSKMDQEAHGIGTKNIMKVVKQNNGKIDFFVVGNIFRVEIVLPKQT